MNELLPPEECGIIKRIKITKNYHDMDVTALLFYMRNSTYMKDFSQSFNPDTDQCNYTFDKLDEEIREAIKSCQSISLVEIRPDIILNTHKDLNEFEKRIKKLIHYRATISFLPKSINNPKMGLVDVTPLIIDLYTEQENKDAFDTESYASCYDPSIEGKIEYFNKLIKKYRTEVILPSQLFNRQV